jgi:hypothetical protein
MIVRQTQRDPQISQITQRWRRRPESFVPFTQLHHTHGSPWVPGTEGTVLEERSGVSAFGGFDRTAEPPNPPEADTAERS